MRRLFPGDGELARRMRGLDWAGGALGMAHAWRPDLRAAVGACLAAPTPVALLWGRSHVLIYNDALAALLGARHPLALGRAARDGWPEAWKRLAPAVEQARATRSASAAALLLVSDPAFPEDRVRVTFTVEPLLGERGRVAGLRCTGTGRAPDGWRGAVEPPETRRRVLIVDDNPDVVAPLAEILERAGHQVASALDGPSALAAARVFTADVAIIDIGLPVMDGYELATRLEAALGPRMPSLIALSGYGRDSDRARSREAGFAIHLAKPIDTAVLLDVVAGRPPRRK